MKSRAFRCVLLPLSCLALGAGPCKDNGRVFDHSEHAEFVDDMPEYSDCTICHIAARREFARAGHAQCIECHDGAITDIEEALDSASRECLECHEGSQVDALLEASGSRTAQDPDLWRQISTRSPGFADVNWSHGDHDDFDCVNCHADKLAAPTSAETFGRSMNQCADCHRENGVDWKCETCHRTLRPDVAPKTHLVTWKRTHGRAARRGAQTCSYCHDASVETDPLTLAADCETCHLTERPRSHTVRWDQSLHGRHAIMDRQRCQTCHMLETCVSCHQSTPPSHIPLARFRQGGHASRARLDQRACRVCHEVEESCTNDSCHNLGP